MARAPVFNPFDDPELASGYEAWYETEGRAAEEAERRLLTWLLSGLPPIQTVLEVGVGTGHFARWLASQWYRVIGVDRSAPMLGEAFRRGSVPLVRADAAELPFADNAFDAALLITTLEFCHILSVRCTRRRGWRGWVSSWGCSTAGIRWLGNGNAAACPSGRLPTSTPRLNWCGWCERRCIRSPLSPGVPHCYRVLPSNTSLACLPAPLSVCVCFCQSRRDEER